MSHNASTYWQRNRPSWQEWLIAAACFLSLASVSVSRWQADRHVILHHVHQDVERAADLGAAYLERSVGARAAIAYAMLAGTDAAQTQAILDRAGRNFSTFSDIFVTDRQGRLVAQLRANSTVPLAAWQSQIAAVVKQAGGSGKAKTLQFTAPMTLPGGATGFYAILPLPLAQGEYVLLNAIPADAVVSRIFDTADGHDVRLRLLIDGRIVYDNGYDNRFADHSALTESRSVHAGGRIFSLQISPGLDHQGLADKTGGGLTGLVLPLLLSAGITAILLAALQLSRRARAHARQFRDFAEIASDMIWETDRNGLLTFVNSREDWGLGVDFGLAAGNSIVDYAKFVGIAATDRVRLAEAIQSRQTFRHLGVAGQRPDGGALSLMVSGRPYYDSNGLFAGYRGVTSNLEGKIEARAALTRAEALLATAVEAISEAFALFDGDDKLVICNKRYRDRLPATLQARLEAGEELTFTEISLAVAEDSIVMLKPGQSPQDYLAERLEQRRSAPSTTTRQYGDGSWVQVWEWPVTGGGIVTVQTDITAAKLHEAALSESESRFRSLVEELPLGLVVLSGQRASFLNEALAQMFGYASMTEILMLDDLSLLFASADENGRPLADYLSAGARQYGLFRARRRNGEEIWTELRAMPVMWRGRERQMLLVSDVTDRQVVLQQLQASRDAAESANRSKSDFLANMSHELRTPLNAIIGFSEILTGQLFGPVGHPRYHEYAEDIHKSGKHLLQIINDILDVAKAEAGRLDLQEEEAAIADLVDAALRMVRERAHTGNIAVLNRVPHTLPPVFVDVLKIKQILLNLLSNAIKFTPSGGHILIEARSLASGGVEIVVQDNGIGMPKDKIALALEPFTQIDSSLSRRYEGTGLGLPLVSALARLHGAQFQIDSDIGAGTRASIILPPERILTEIAAAQA